MIIANPIKNFDDLEAWKKARILHLQIYKNSESFPKHELFGLTSQLRRAAGSICANIAEGFDRYHSKDKIRFYHIARASSAEVINFLILASDLKYLNKSEYQKLGLKTKEVSMLINGLVRSINKNFNKK